MCSPSNLSSYIPVLMVDHDMRPEGHTDFNGGKCTCGKSIDLCQHEQADMCRNLNTGRKRCYWNNLGISAARDISRTSLET